MTQIDLGVPATAAALPAPRFALIRFAPLLAFLLALGLRLPFVNAGLFHVDEVVLAESVEASLARHELVPAVKGRHGAVLVTLAFYAPWHAATGASAERVVPVVGTVLGAALVAMVLLLATELAGDSLAGLLAGAFTACGAIFLSSSSTGKENAPQMAFVTLAFWLLARGSARGSHPLRIAAAALFAFSLTLHEAGVVLVPAFAFAAAWWELRGGGGGPRALALDLGALALALVVPFRLSIAEELRRNVLGSGFNSASFQGLLTESFPWAMRDGLVGIGPAVLAFALLGAGIAVWRRKETRLAALLPWPLAVLYFGNVSSYTPRYLLFVLPPLVVLAGAGAAWAVRRLQGRWRLAATAAALLAGCVPGVVEAYPLLARRAAESGPKAMALLVRDRTPPNAIVLCEDDGGFLRYYAPGRTFLTVPYGNLAPLVQLVRELQVRARAGARIYAGEYAFAYDEQSIFRQLMNAAFVPVAVGSVVNEWYYRPELSDQRFPDTLYEFLPR